MLNIHFFNVAEGDSILLEYKGGDSPYRVLIDTGRSFLPESEGSLRLTADQHLRKMKISYIDALVITHLHVDHIQALPKIMDSVRFGSIYCTYFPKDPSIRIPSIQSEFKAVRELSDDLNTLAESIQRSDKKGTKKILVAGDTFIPLADKNGSILIRMPLEDTLDFQNAVCDKLFSGEPVPETDIYRAAKSRNNNSLRLLVRYAGRSIALDGDYYALIAEKENHAPCDILKAAHHGDRKSMTDRLASMLRPKITVISCKREYDAKKDRPSKTCTDLLRKYGSEIIYTDCFSEAGRPVHYHEKVLITINKKGTIRILSPSQVEAEKTV